jgi:adenylate kinase
MLMIGKKLKTIEKQGRCGRNLQRRVILVTGTPGVGKTSVSRLLAFKIGAKLVILGELVKRENLIIGVDDQRETLIVDTVEVLTRLKKTIADSHRDVIVDGHYSVDVVPSDNVHLVFVLRRDPDELRRLMENRGFSEAKIQENISAEILDVCLWNAVKACGVDKVCEIDVSGKSAEEVCGEAVSVLEGKRNPSVGIVDWLGKLDREGRLHEFFTD